MKQREARFAGAMEEIWDGIALLRFASKELPVGQRHLFLQAVNRLVDIAMEVAGLFEPITPEECREFGCDDRYKVVPDAGDGQPAITLDARTDAS
jgi:hypothetical protein